jgi:hypothetical protein
MEVLMRRALLALFSGLLAAAAACSFPNVMSFEQVDASRSGPDARVSPDGHVEPGDDGSTPPDGGMSSSDGGDATTGSDADAATDSAGQPDVPLKEAGPDGYVNCDYDKDGFKAEGPPCFGLDCCDTDDAAYPGQTTWFTNEDHCGAWNYACGKTFTEEYHAWSCTGLGALCSADAGYVSGVPTCGQSGQWSASCMGTVTCDPGSTDTVTQGCH